MSNDGFIPDQQTSKDGFVADSQASGGDYWGDVKKNAIEGAKEIPQGALAFADTGSKVASLTSPAEIGKSVFQASRGTPFGQTNTGQDMQAASGALRSVPGMVRDTAQNAWNVAKSPFQIMSGTPPTQTDIGQDFRQRPLGTIAQTASWAVPAARMFAPARAAVPLAEAGAAAPLAEGGAARTFPAASQGPGMSVEAETPLPSYLETKGGQGLNSIAGIRSRTVEGMTRQGQNPGVVGTNLAKTLSDEGAIGSTATETYQKASKVANQYGQKVDTALTDIKNANKSLGVYPEMADSLKVESNPILKPILDNANKLAKSQYPVDRATARGWKAMYNSLSDKAQANGEWLTLDDVRDELQKVGDMYDTAGPNHQGVIDQLYGHLANMRDSMVKDIAERTGDPKLSANLIKANEGYSRYMRLLPDIKRAAAMESTGQMNLGGIFKDLKGAILSGPTASKTVMGAGRTVRRIFGNEHGGVSLGTDLPEVAPGSKTGSPHALYAYSDDWGPGGAQRKMYNVFGDPNHPTVQKAGWGSSVTQEMLDKHGIPVIGREPPR